MKDEYTIGCDVTLEQVPAMFARWHGLMTGRSADDQGRHIFEDVMFNVIKGN